MERKNSNLYSKLLAKHIVVQDKLGEGNFGAVYQGRWKGTMLALKFLTNADRSGIQECLEEIEMPTPLSIPTSSVFLAFALGMRRRIGRWMPSRLASHAS